MYATISSQLVKVCYDSRLRTVLNAGVTDPGVYAWCKRTIYIARSLHALLLRDNHIETPVPPPRPDRATLLMRVAAYAIKQGMLRQSGKGGSGDAERAVLDD